MRINKKIAIFAVAALLAAGGAAFGFWTTSGAGQGTATGGTPGNFTVVVNVADGIYPNGSVAVTGTITNNTQSSLEVHTISADPTFNTTGVETSNALCLPADFHFINGVVTGGTQTLASSGGSTGFTGDLAMDDTSINQDACKSPTTITLHLVAA